MAGAILKGGRVAYDEDFNPRPLSTDEIPVRVLTAGICETDLQLVRGYMGFEGVLGHEFVGIAQSGTFEGRRVAGEINCPCGECRLCSRGLGNHCPHRTVLGILGRDGAFANVVYLPEANLHPVPDHVPDDVATFVEPVAAAFQIPAQLDLSRFQRAIVLGDGRLGILCAQVIRRHIADCLLVGKHRSKLEVAETLGLRTVMLETLAGDRDADLVVDATGSPSGLEAALKLIEPRGTIVLKTTTAAPTGPNPAAVVIDEVTIVGSRCGPFPEAIDALARGEIQVRPLISDRFLLSEVEHAFERAHAAGVLKVLLDIEAG